MNDELRTLNVLSFVLFGVQIYRLGPGAQPSDPLRLVLCQIERPSSGIQDQSHDAAFRLQDNRFPLPSAEIKAL